jgi:hypothetical protein
MHGGRARIHKEGRACIGGGARTHRKGAHA